MKLKEILNKIFEKLKKIFKKQNVMPVAVLSVICLAVAVLISGINLLTRAEIEKKESEKISESLSIVMPGGEFSEAMKLPDDAPSTVKAVYEEKNGMGHVVVLNKQGYKSIISLSVGISSDKKIVGAVITSEQESHGKSGIDEYVSGFVGAGAGNIDSLVSANHVSGATVTSEKIGEAIYDAFVVLGYAEAKGSSDADTFDYAGVTSTTDEEAIAIARELMPGEYTKASTEGMPTTVRSVYKNSNGGYAVHVATRTKYVPLESEGVITVDKFGYITGVRMINWTVGYDKTLLDAPPQYTAEFLNSYVGKYSSSLNRVEVVTHATLTSNNFTDALKGALDVLYPTKAFSIVAAVLIALAVAAPTAAVVIIKVRRKKNAAK